MHKERQQYTSKHILSAPVGPPAGQGPWWCCKQTTTHHTYKRPRLQLTCSCNNNAPYKAHARRILHCNSILRNPKDRCWAANAHVTPKLLTHCLDPTIGHTQAKAMLTALQLLFLLVLQLGTGSCCIQDGLQLQSQPHAAIELELAQQEGLHPSTQHISMFSKQPPCS